MLSCRLTSHLSSSRSRATCSHRAHSLQDRFSRPQLPAQTRTIFGGLKSRVKRWFGPARDPIPLIPASSIVMFSQHLSWVRAGPAEGSVLIGLTEEAKDLLRPIGELVVREEFDTFLAPSTPIGYMRFYHPDDIEHNRAEMQVLEWEFKMPLAGTLKSANPLISARPILASDPHFNDWLFCIEDVLERDWNKLMTSKEYEDYLQSTENILGIDWKASPYANAWFELATRKTKEPEPLSTEDQVKELLRAQKKRGSM